MKISRKLLLAAASIFCMAASSNAQTTVNIDFNGTRNNPGPDPDPVTYVGPGAVSAGAGGTFFNGLLADSRLPGNLDNDALTVAGTDLKDEFGATTPFDFTISPVGGDTNGGDALTTDYIFVNSAGSTSDANFTISDLGGSTADLYFLVNFTQSSPGVFIPGSTGTPGFVGNGHTYVFFDNVPISGGVITGTLGDPNAAADVTVLSGLTIDAIAIPEPGSLALAVLGGIAVAVRRRR